MATEKASSDVLPEFAVTFGKPRPAAANRPTRLNDSRVVWFVERGAIDVLAAECVDDRIQSPFKHLMRLEQGRLAFGVDEDGHSLMLMAKGVQSSCLRCLSLDRLIEELGKRDKADELSRELILQADAWIEDLAAAVAREVEGRPRTEFRLSPGSAMGRGISSAERGVVWVVADNLDAAFLEVVDAAADGPGLMPIT